MAGDDSIVGFGNPEVRLRMVELVTGAIARRWLSVAAITVLFVSVGCAAAVVLPRTYWSEARLLVTRNPLMPALANPRRSVPSGAAAPRRGRIPQDHDGV